MVSPFGANGIYLDNASNNFTVTNNVIVRADCGIAHNEGSEDSVENNIFIDMRELGHIFGLSRDATNVTFRRNIVWWNKPQAPLPALMFAPGGTQPFVSDYNLIWAGGATTT